LINRDYTHSPQSLRVGGLQTASNGAIESPGITSSLPVTQEDPHAKRSHDLT
jgi:hypothetical protein